MKPYFSELLDTWVKNCNSEAIFIYEGGLICLFLWNWSPRSDFIWPILFLHPLPEGLPHSSQYQMARSKQQYWYWGEVPCLSFLPAAQSFLLRHSWRRRSVSPFYLHAPRVDQGKYPTDFYPDDSSRRRFSATLRRSTGLGQTCSFRWEAMAGSTPLLTSARKSTDHLFIKLFLNGTFWYVRW